MNPNLYYGDFDGTSVGSMPAYVGRRSIFAKWGICPLKPLLSNGE